jgi:hypothetical protein
MSRASDLLALANLNKHDRYQADRAKLQTAKKDDWRWVGYDSTIGMGVVQSGNITRTGKVITNGYLVAGQPVEFNQDGQFGTIEGPQYVKPQPRSKPQYIPKGLNLKIAYTVYKGVDEDIRIGGWKESTEPVAPIVAAGDLRVINIPSSSTLPTPTLLGLNNLGGDDWSAQILRCRQEGVNSQGFRILTVFASDVTQNGTQDVPLLSSYEPIIGHPSNSQALVSSTRVFFVSVGGGYVISSFSTMSVTYDAPVNFRVETSYVGRNVHLWERSTSTVLRPSYITPVPEGGLALAYTHNIPSSLGESYYQVPPNLSLSTALPIATDGAETLSRSGIGNAATYSIFTSSGAIPIPKPNIENIDAEQFQARGALATLKMIERKIYYVPETQITAANMTSSNIGEIGTVTIRICDLIAGTFTEEQIPFYKIPVLPDEIFGEVLSCCVSP